MKILGIETSCDETAVCIIDCEGNPSDGNFKINILGDALHSQIDLHKEFGGVVPFMAKREHAKNLIPLFIQSLKQADLFKEYSEKNPLNEDAREKLNEIFGREIEFKNNFIEFIETTNKPHSIEAIAITEGPGLEPALWMGIIFSKALSLVYDLPLIPINHMEGHIMSVLPNLNNHKIKFPAISLLISGGHTELILMRDWHSYEIIGETRDDAVGEAFDKVARMLDLPYPGGPEISRLADLHRKTKTSTQEYILPRPMINSKDFNFSFSGIKTAVLYSLKNNHENKIPKEIVAKEFEEAVTEVLVTKTLKALEEYNAETLILGGGVVSNKYLRKEFKKEIKKISGVSLLIPENKLRTDNAVMIAISAYLRIISNKNNIKSNDSLVAKGRLRLG